LRVSQFSSGPWAKLTTMAWSSQASERWHSQAPGVARSWDPALPQAMKPPLEAACSKEGAPRWLTSTRISFAPTESQGAMSMGSASGCAGEKRAGP